jgi:hypothetical protein
MEKRCLCCKRPVLAHPAVAHQRYCSDPECQKARKRNWQKEKLGKDPDYRANQADAQRQWRSRNRVTGESTAASIRPIGRRIGFAKGNATGAGKRGVDYHIILTEFIVCNLTESKGGIGYFDKTV